MGQEIKHHRETARFRRNPTKLQEVVNRTLRDTFKSLGEKLKIPSRRFLDDKILLKNSTKREKMQMNEKILNTEFIEQLWNDFTDTKKLEILNAGLGQEYVEEKFLEYLDQNGK